MCKCRDYCVSFVNCIYLEIPACRQAFLFHVCLVQKEPIFRVVVSEIMQRTTSIFNRLLARLVAAEQIKEHLHSLAGYPAADCNVITLLQNFPSTAIIT